MKYDFISDPGHGWLKVKRKEVEALGIHVSRYSYQRGVWVYLEEDCDAPRFLQAKEARGERVEFRERTSRERASKIRSYDGFLPWNGDIPTTD